VIKKLLFTKRHFFDGATRFFRIDNGRYQGVFCFFFAAKTRRCRRCTSTRTKLAMLALPLSVVPWRTSIFHLMNELSLKKTFLLAPPDFSRLIMGHYHSVFLLLLFGSQSTSLTELVLRKNKIGDAGASGLGDGLMYVSFCLYDELLFSC
jgi:hypothetical protein